MVCTSVSHLTSARSQPWLPLCIQSKCRTAGWDHCTTAVSQLATRLQSIACLRCILHYSSTWSDPTSATHHRPAPYPYTMPPAAIPAGNTVHNLMPTKPAALHALAVQLPASITAPDVSILEQMQRTQTSIERKLDRIERQHQLQKRNAWRLATNANKDVDRPLKPPCSMDEDTSALVEATEANASLADLLPRISKRWLSQAADAAGLRRWLVFYGEDDEDMEPQDRAQRLGEIFGVRV